MATGVLQEPPAGNTVEHEVTITGCVCQAKNKEIIQTVCHNGKIETKLTHLSSESSDMRDILSSCVCCVIVLCSHILELISAPIIGSEEEKKVILVGGENELSTLSGMVSVRSDEPDFLQILFDMIHTKVNYEDCSVPLVDTDNRSSMGESGYEEYVEYIECTDIPTVDSKSKQNQNIIEETHEETGNSDSDEDNNYTKYEERYGRNQNDYQTLTVKPRANFINLKTGENSKDALVGPNVVQEYFHPSRSYWKELPDVISEINTGTPAAVSDLTKYVCTYVIPTARTHDDLLTLSELSRCEGHCIENKVVKEIQDLLFTTDVSCYKTDVLFQSLEVLLDVVKRKAVSSTTTKLILPNVILTLSFVDQILLGQVTKDTNDINGRICALNEILEKTKYAPPQETERHLLKATRMMLRALKKTASGKRDSCLQLLGSCREELTSDSTINNLTCAADKMTISELYSLISRLFVMMHLGTELSTRLIDFLHTTVKKSAKKSENISELYPLLVIVCRGIASLLNLHVHQDQQTMDMQDQTNDKLCEILQTCVEKIKSKRNRDCNKALQEELWILLFHRSSNVSKQIHMLMSSLGRVCMADNIPAYLQTILGPLGLTLRSEKNENTTKSLPRWQEFTGSIVGRKQASVNVLLPDNDSFDLDAYVNSAIKDPTNGRHYNTMEMLKCLHGNNEHPHIRRLIAFQFQPKPVFYVTELLPDATLSTFLIATRKTYDWQPLEVLGSIAVTCVEVANFLHEKKIVHRNLIADSFKRRGNNMFVLADLSIASFVDDDSVGSGIFVQNIDGKFIPTRWSAPESLLNDRYDAMSDTWMLGLLMHEIFTHGIHPFRDMYATKLDDIMENVVFNNLSPRWYPCIPCPIHEIIVECVKTNPDERPALPGVLQRIRDWLRLLHTEEAKLPKLQHSTFSKKNSEYPELDELQGDPERGPTEQLRNLKKINKNSKVSYYNKVDLRRLSKYPNKIQIKEKYMKAVDHPTIVKQDGCLVVREPVSRTFMNDTFSKMTSKPEFMAALTIADNPEKSPRSSTDPDGFVWTLTYRCQNAESLHEIAQIHKYGDPGAEENQLPYLRVVESLLQFINWMHEQHWILRDVCCSTTFRTIRDGRVFMPRLGRMIKDRRRISRIEACITDKNICIEDRRNWMPAEVIDGGQFSQASDVYMAAMTVYEFYSTADLGRKNPMYNCLEAVPFAKVEPKLLLDTLNRGIVPVKPMSCPLWLYELMRQCWTRDSTQRLTAAAFLSEISQKLATAYSSPHGDRMSYTDRHRESEGSDSSMTLLKEVYSSKQQPTLPPRQISITSAVRSTEKDEVKLRKLKWAHLNDGMSKNQKCQSNDYQTVPITNVKSPGGNNRFDADPVAFDDPVYRGLGSTINKRRSEVVDSTLYQTTQWKASGIVDDDYIVGYEKPPDKDQKMEFHGLPTNDGYLTCSFSSEMVDGEEKREGNNDNRASLNPVREPLRNQAVSSTSTSARLQYPYRISAKVPPDHPYDNASPLRKFPKSISTQRNPENTEIPVTSGADIRLNCSREQNVPCSCSLTSCSKDYGSCGADGSERNSSSETCSVFSCGNSSCKSGSVVSSESSWYEKESQGSCRNSSCETCSVISCGNSLCETCSVVSCGNSSSGTPDELELKTKL